MNEELNLYWSNKNKLIKYPFNGNINSHKIHLVKNRSQINTAIVLNKLNVPLSFLQFIIRPKLS